MPKSKGASKTIHPWSKNALLSKAQRYAQEMQGHSRDDWQFGLASTFVLEFLARATLANFSPAFLAEPKERNNLYFALGHSPTAQKFIPRSIDSSAVLASLRVILPSFTKELEGYAAEHLNRRNEELHAGSTPFDGLNTKWIANFYQVCTVLLTSLGEQLSFLFGVEEAKVAEKLIAASQDESAKSVLKAIAAHKKEWEAKDALERKKSTAQASAWATRQSGHRVVCPACANDALVVGAPTSEPMRKLEGDLIVEVQEYLPAKFECVACNLKISGLSQLSACNLGNTYKSTSTYDAAEYYAPDDEYAGFDEDNNEP